MSLPASAQPSHLRVPLPLSLVRDTSGRWGAGVWVSLWGMGGVSMSPDVCVPHPQVVKVRPNDKDAKLKYQECHKIVKQKAFERAIASDEHKRSVVDSLDIESMSEPPDPPCPLYAPSKSRLPFLCRQGGRRRGP